MLPSQQSDSLTPVTCHLTPGLAVVLVVGAVVRLLLIIWFHGQPIYVADARAYNAIAVNLLEHGQFASTPGVPTSIRPPLYPAFVAGVYWAAGSENYTAVRVIQGVIGLFTTWIVYQLAKNMYGGRVALWTAVGVCFYPALVFQGNLVLTETLFTFLLCLFCLLIECVLRGQSEVPDSTCVQRPPGLSSKGGPSAFSRNALWLLAAGAVLGLAALTRSVLWLFPPFLLVFVFCAIKRPEEKCHHLDPRDEASLHGTLRQRCRTFIRRAALALAPVLAFCLVVAPWAVRNTRLQKTFTTIDVMGGRNFMMGNYEHTSMFRAWATIDEARGEQAWYRVLRSEHPEFPRLTQGQKDKLAMKRGLKFAIENPVLTAQRDVVKFLNFWQLERAVVAGFMRGFWGDQPRPVVLGIGAMMAGSYALVMLLAVFGFVMTRPADTRLHWFVFLLLAFVCALHSAVFGHERYRLPLMPLVILYAAAALVHWQEIWRERQRWAFWLAAGLCLLLTVGWVWELSFVEMDRIREMLRER